MLRRVPKMRAVLVRVNDKMQKGYRYRLTEPMGKNFDPEFNPDLSPKQMLTLGIFGGKYMTDCTQEFPPDWFKRAKLSPSEHAAGLNYFKVNASQSRLLWLEKDWIFFGDPRGWFQWYCRYYMGRRIPIEDRRQIRRWKAIKRHIGALKKNCKKGDCRCRPRQRQALLHWAYDSRKL
jgi:hypothetical protein